MRLAIYMAGRHANKVVDLHEGARDYMAHHPFCTRKSRMDITLDIARFDLSRPGVEVVDEATDCAAQHREGGPPVRGRMLVLVTMGETIEDGDERREGVAGRC